MMTEIPEHIIELLSRSRLKKLTVQERKQLIAWFSAHPEWGKEWAEWQQLIMDCKLSRISHAIDPEAGWKKVEERYRLSRRQKIIRRFASWRKIAAIWLPLLVVSSLIYFEQKRQAFESVPVYIDPGRPQAELILPDGETIALKKGEQQQIMDRKGQLVGVDSLNTLVYAARQAPQEEWNTLRIPLGGEYKLILADGTEVWLNAGSSLKYFTRGIEKERKVYLTGEAYFKVAPDKDRPFLVFSGEHAVKVLGTEFNISAYEDDQMIYTTLVSGRVSVGIDGQHKANHILEHSGKQSIYNKEGTKGLTLRQVDAAVYTAWKDGSFVFNYSTLKEVMKKLSRWYNFEFEIQDEQLKKSRFSGAFNRFENFSRVLEVIESTGVPIKIEYKNGKMTIR